MGSVFANVSGDQGSILDQVIPKTQKMGLDTSLLNTQHYKVCIKGKVEQSRERSCTLPYILVLFLLKKDSSGHPRLQLPTYLIQLRSSTTTNIKKTCSWCTGHVARTFKDHSVWRTGLWLKKQSYKDSLKRTFIKSSISSVAYFNILPKNIASCVEPSWYYF